MSSRAPGPLLLAVVLFIALCTTLLVASTASCDGRLTYALDDAYAELATARNLAAHGRWGVTQHAFTSTATSPLWTAALSVASLVTGPRPGWPLVLNLLAGLAVIGVAEQAVRLLAPRAGKSSTLAVLCAVVLLAPLPSLAFTGQEHVLLAMLALSYALAAAVAAEEVERTNVDSRPDVLLAGLGLPMVATSHDGMFLVTAAALLLFARDKRRLAVTAFLAPLAPVLGYALIALSQGWPAVPAALLLDLPATGGVRVLEQLVAAPHLLALILAAVVLAGRRREGAPPDIARSLLLLFVGATLLHLEFGRTGWFHRHTAHLTVLGLVAVGARLTARSAADFGFSTNVELRRVYRTRRLRRALLALVMLVPLIQRGLIASYQIPRTTAHVYAQEVQAALFLGRHYKEATVALSRAGAAGWLSDCSVLDLSGHASAEVLRYRLAGAWSRQALDNEARQQGARIAIVFEKALVPETWERVGTWRIPSTPVHGSDTLGFYAIQPSERAELERALDAFRERLPRTVIVSLDPPARRM